MKKNRLFTFLVFMVALSMTFSARAEEQEVREADYETELGDNISSYLESGDILTVRYTAGSWEEICFRTAGNHVWIELLEESSGKTWNAES